MKRNHARRAPSRNRSSQVSQRGRATSNQSIARQLTLSIHDLSTDGKGVARVSRDVYFVPGALIGEEVEVEVGARQKKIWQCQLKTINTASEARVEPECQHYRICGGCDLQHLSYDAQVSFKQTRVAKEFARQNIQIADDQWQSPIIGSPWHYRRRARVGVRYNKQNEQFFIGFRQEGKSHLANIDSCPVLVDHPSLVWADWHQRFAQLDCKDRLTHIEVLQADNRLALVFRVLKQLPNQDRALFAEWADQLDIDIYWRDDNRELHPLVASPAVLSHRIQGHDLQVTPDYFMQVNQSVNQQMVDRALEWMNVQQGEQVWDLFAGHGNFSLPMAATTQVTAVEVSDQMVAALEVQAERLNSDEGANDVLSAGQLKPIKADLTDDTVLGQLPTPDAVLLDPPRAGAIEILDTIIAAEPKRIVYVSCDPATLARDLVKLQAEGYYVKQACVLDMFPQTHHVETMVLLTQ